VAARRSRLKCRRWTAFPPDRGSQDGTAGGKRVWASDVLVAPAARAEFIVTCPSSSVQSAALMTLNVDTGPDGDNDPTRPIAAIHASDDAPELPHKQRFAGLEREKPSAERTLYFSEVISDPSHPSSPTNFFVTVDGQTPALFSPDNPPAIVTTQGAVEDWSIENRSMENHEFHIHQIHFLVLEQNGIPLNDGQYLDTIQMPYWPGFGPYPSAKLRMDFRGQLVGDFVYHWHILGNEGRGMMAIIRVKVRAEQGRR
jgi:FtsP/CotA-like multicopper oxidase with cupredoxin domain